MWVGSREEETLSHKYTEYILQPPTVGDRVEAMCELSLGSCPPLGPGCDELFMSRDPISDTPA